MRSGLGLGSNASNYFLSPNQKISNRVILPQVTIPLKVQYKFFDYFGLEAGYQWSVHSVNAVNPRFRKTPSSTNTKADDSVPVVLHGRKLYHTLNIAAYGFIPLRWHENDDELQISLYIGAGILFNRRIGSAVSHDSYLHQPDNFWLDYTTQYTKQYNTAFFELGLNNDGGESNNKKTVLFVGIKYFYYSPTIMTGSYNVYSNNLLINHDDLRANYGHVMFSLEIGKYIFYNPKKLSQLIPIKLHFPSYSKVHDSLLAQKVKNDSLVIVRKQAEKKAAMETMGNRPVQTTHIINVYMSTLTMKLWDKQIVDGDIVSLNLNGKWILENYNLTTHKQEVEITLEPGENNLVLYAISEGRRKSCTVAVIFDDGHKQVQLLLDSDLKKSSAVQINYIP